MKFYKATQDRLSVIITVGVIILFLAIGFIPSNLTGSRFGASQIPMIWILINILNGSILLFCYLFHVTGYELTAESLIIRRPAKNRRILFSEIREIKSVLREDLKWSVRTFGNGGVFGYYGKFYNTKFGSMTWYASQRDQFVMIILNDGEKVVLTPDDLSFTNDISTYISHSTPS
ncbi:MAG: PH domain-containing protein [Cyclobacteriaceae bacterium]